MRYSQIIMKYLSAIAVCVCSLAVAASAYGQSTRCPPDTICDPLKFDEYGTLTWADEKARLDNLVLQLRAIPVDFGAFFFIYAGRNACVGEALSRGSRTKNYLVRKRGVKPSRVVWLDGGYREHADVEIWILPLDIGKPEPYPTLDRNEVRLKNCASNRRPAKKSTRAHNKALQLTAR